MKKSLSLLMIVFLMLASFMPVNFVTFAEESESLDITSSLYKVTYNHADYDNQNTISNIPAYTNVNIFLYNMEKDNPDYIFNIDSLPNSWENITISSDKPMTLTVKKENNGKSEQFTLIPGKYSIVDDFEKYPLGEFVSNGLWNENKSSTNYGKALICEASDGNRFHRFISPGTGDSDYSDIPAKSSTNENAIQLNSANFGVKEGEKAELKFKIRKNEGSKIFAWLRNTNSSSDTSNRYFRPIYSFKADGTVTCFSASGYALDSEKQNIVCKDNEWNEFKIVFDRQNNNKIQVFINDSANSVAESGFSADFSWEDFYVIFGPDRATDETQRTEIDIDDFSFTKEENDDTFKVEEVNTYKKSDDGTYECSGRVINGTNTFKVTLKNNTQDSKPVYVIFAEKNDEKLVGVTVAEASVSGEQKKYATLEAEVKDASKNRLEIYVWEKDKFIPLNDTFKPETAKVNDAISKGHPRILADSDTFLRIRKSTDEDNLNWKTTVLNYADNICNGFPTVSANSEFFVGVKGTTFTFTDMSRRVKKFGIILGMAYQLTKDEKYSEKLYEILMAAKDADWSGMSNLTAAYITDGFSVGFDWCYEGLEKAQREEIASVIIERSLPFAMYEYTNEKRTAHTWSKTYTNWNAVSNSSFITCALAFSEYEPELCQTLLDYSSERLKIFLSGLAPDGGWWEGMMYIPLVFSHLAKASESLKTCSGQDDVIADTEFIKRSAEFLVGVMGPYGTHNFAEQSAGTRKVYCDPELLWLAKISGRKDIAGWALEKINFSSADNCALSLLWYSGKNDADEYEFENFYARAVEHITLGNGNMGDSSWLSVLGGVNMGQHKHLDLGSFVYDYKGLRWATEFGSDEYHTGYQSDTSAKKIFYRTRAEGHNTLEINPSSASGGQRMNDTNGISKGEVISYNLRKDKPYAVYDLTTAYQDKASSVKRGFRMLDNNIGFIVRDEFTTNNASDKVYWYMHTDAEIEILEGGKSAKLTQDGETMMVTVLEEGLSLTKANAFTPDDILSELLSISNTNGWQLDKQYKNEGYEKLKITGTGSGSITVMVAPSDKSVPQDATLNLNEWN